MTEWFAAQPWSNGRVGMFGRSYLGIMQYLAASEAPPHLKAIFPEMALFDLYEFSYPGGIFRDDFARKWGETIRGLDEATASAPVQGEEALLAQAAQAHRSNGDIFRMLEGLPNRDSRGAGGAPLGYEANNPAARLGAVGKSKVAVYHLAGWHDMWPRDALLWFENLENPQKIIIGPWAHGESQGFGLAAEHLRWYDYWLKGVDNGVMNEAPSTTTLSTPRAGGSGARRGSGRCPRRSRPVTTCVQARPARYARATTARSTRGLLKSPKAPTPTRLITLPPPALRAAGPTATARPSLTRT